MRPRDLGDVLHYFIPEEEQREARARALAPGDAAPRPSPRASHWCLAASPERPLSCAVAVDLAVACRRSGVPVRILAAFPCAHLIPRSAEIEWQTLEPAELAPALEGLPPSMHAFVLVPPDQLGSVLRTLPAGHLEGLLLAVDALPSGPAQALALLRGLAQPSLEIRIAAVTIGAPNSAQAAEFSARLQAAAWQQLRLEVEDLGELRRDPASFQALLRGIPVLDVDEEASSAQSLRALCARLV